MEGARNSFPAIEGTAERDDARKRHQPLAIIGQARLHLIAGSLQDWDRDIESAGTDIERDRTAIGKRLRLTLADIIIAHRSKANDLVICRQIDRAE
mgnify:CR=1 FL=1